MWPGGSHLNCTSETVAMADSQGAQTSHPNSGCYCPQCLTGPKYQSMLLSAALRRRPEYAALLASPPSELKRKPPPKKSKEKMPTKKKKEVSACVGLGVECCCRCRGRTSSPPSRRISMAGRSRCSPSFLLAWPSAYVTTCLRGHLLAWPSACVTICLCDRLLA